MTKNIHIEREFHAVEEADAVKAEADRMAVLTRRLVELVIVLAIAGALVFLLS